MKLDKLGRIPKKRSHRSQPQLDYNEQRARNIMDKYGQDRVLEAARTQILTYDHHGFCDYCKKITPIYRECCLVCDNKFV